MIRATIWIASPTLLSSVVLVVLKPRSLMMIVEKLLTTPIDIWILADVESKTTGLSKKLDKRTVGNGSCED